MKSIFLTRGGGTEVLQFGEQPKPSITHDDQVLVRVIAAGVNPIDTKIRSAPDRFPVEAVAILGCDAAGVIEQTGSSVSHLKIGDEVYFSQPGFNGRQGTYAEHVVVDAALVAHKPKSLSFTETAAVPLVAITAWEALHDRARIQSGQKVLIHAGAGGVGHVAIQLAKAVGANVITSVSSKEKSDFVKQLGADKYILYKQDDVLSEVMSWTNNKGVDVSFDTVGGDTLISCFACTKVYGDVVTILQPANNANWSEARKRNLRFSFELMLTPVMMNLPEAKQHQGNILNKCAKLIDDGKLKIHVARTFGLEMAADAHHYLEQERPAGKVVLTLE